MVGGGYSERRMLEPLLTFKALVRSKGEDMTKLTNEEENILIMGLGALLFLFILLAFTLFN